MKDEALSLQEYLGADIQVEMSRKLLEGPVWSPREKAGDREEHCKLTRQMTPRA